MADGRFYSQKYFFFEFINKLKQPKLGTAVDTTFAPPYVSIIMDELETMNFIVRNHLKAHFNILKESKLEPFTCNPIALDIPVTKDEAAKSIHKLQNNSAPGYDQLLPEL